jgi:Cu-Zn family superoxide dismutase
MKLQSILFAILLATAIPLLAEEELPVAEPTTAEDEIPYTEALPPLISEPITRETVVIRAINKNGLGVIIGSITLSDSSQGLVIEPDLNSLNSGPHGMHVHQNFSCDPGEKDGEQVAGLEAGGHYDPSATSRHEGPRGDGHAGDLPILEVNGAGNAFKTSLAPHLKLEDIRFHALIIHENGDNYSDQPKPLGGGGSRVACGLIQ